MSEICAPASRTRAVWLAADAPAAFEQAIARTTELAEWPRASAVRRNVPVYDGDEVRAAALDPGRRLALMAEWAELLAGGPGVLVISRAFADTGPVDRASALFESIIEAQHARSDGGGDHFARPGANDRIWNALEKHCLADPEGFASYYANVAIALASEAWLGEGYQMTAQVNRVNPGGEAQSAHRDYHLGFMTPERMTRFPAHVHRLSPVLTLQGAVAHCDMPVETGPTLYLPYSQTCLEGYLAFARPDTQAMFREHRVQLPLAKGDAVFFNPALLHAAGENRTREVRRMANLLQVSSALGRAMETVDRVRMSVALYPVLLAARRRGSLSATEIDCAVGACAEGYAFPTNLDRDPPVEGLAPRTQADLMREALSAGTDPAAFSDSVAAQAVRRAP